MGPALAPSEYHNEQISNKQQKIKIKIIIPEAFHQYPDPPGAQKAS